MLPRAPVLSYLLLGLASAQYEETINHLFPVQSEVHQDELNNSEMRCPFEDMMSKMPRMDDGQMMYQEDMMITERDLRDMYALAPARNITWPGGIVPYKIDQALVNQADLIQQAIAHWMNNSCIKFRELQEDDTTTDYILFIRGIGCWSQFGRVGSLQRISIGIGCERLGTVVHEIGHAIGFLHEQSRGDRDRYVVVNYPNIPEEWHCQFERDQRKREYGAQYDYTSIMHYPQTAFAASPETKTLISVNPLLSPLIRRQDGLTFRDRRKANFLYQCDAACTSKPECLNEGFVDDTCKCVCPPNTEGERCERLRRWYYSRPNCGGRVIRDVTIASPGYPYRQKPEVGVCVWWIQVPANRTLQLTFRKFDLYDRVRGFCIYDQFEIRLQSLYMGQMYCGDEIKPGKVITSVGSDAIIEYRPYNKYKIGFAADVKFVPA